MINANLQLTRLLRCPNDVFDKDAIKFLINERIDELDVNYVHGYVGGELVQIGTFFHLALSKALTTESVEWLLCLMLRRGMDPMIQCDECESIGTYCYMVALRAGLKILHALLANPEFDVETINATGIHYVLTRRELSLLSRHTLSRQFMLRMPLVVHFTSFDDFEYFVDCCGKKILRLLSWRELRRIASLVRSLCIIETGDVREMVIGGDDDLACWLLSRPMFDVSDTDFRGDRLDAVLVVL